MDFVLEHVNKQFGDLLVLQDLNMRVKENKLICILGPSGSGKTTLLNIMSGVLAADSGEVIGFADRTISYLFQETRLLKWKTVKDNIDFVIKDKLNKKQREEIIDKYLQMVGLSEFSNYHPEKLSGGMKQRVSIARAFAYPADILLMDEPFKGLDMQLKKALINAFLNLWLLDQRSVFFVTHDIDEAVLIGEEIYVLTDRPASIKGTIVNNIPHKERDLLNANIGYVKNQIHELLS